jgi:peptidyl-prolyl cis-trans isomerase C
MKKLFLILSLSSLVGIALTLIGPSISDRAKAEDPVVAKVNGAEITLSQLTPLIEEYRRRSHKSEVKQDEIVQVLKGMIRRHLILQQKEAVELRSEKEIASQVKEFENKLVVAAFLERHVGKHLTVTDEEIKKYYEENIQKFSSPPKVKARHILLRTREEAEAVLAKLREGQDFGQMAKEYSIDLPMAREGGPMGTIEKGRTLPELEKALFVLKVGEISDVVQTRFGFHILTVDEIITTQFRPLDEVKEGIRKGLLQQKEAKAFDEMTAELEYKAEIQIFEERLRQSAP